MFRNPFADGLIVLVIVLLFFGPKRLPELGKSLGAGLREFKDSITGSSKDDEETETDRPALAPAPTAASPPGAPASTSEPAENGGAGVSSEHR